VTLPKVSSVAADSNVLLSAVAGRAARRVFGVPELIVVTTEHNVAEVAEYIPEFASRYRLHEDVVFQTLALLPIVVFAEHQYAEQLSAAHGFIAERDQDDIALAALAMKLRIPIWSNDRDYEHFIYGQFTTAQLSTLLAV
jgi:predicted nucleic acid-binding protein